MSEQYVSVDMGARPGTQDGDARETKKGPIAPRRTDPRDKRGRITRCGKMNTVQVQGQRDGRRACVLRVRGSARTSNNTGRMNTAEMRKAQMGKQDRGTV